MSLGKRLKELRALKKLSQSDLAIVLNVDRSTYGKYETGDSSPDYEKLIKLAEFFDVTVDYLLKQSIRSLIEERLSELGMTLEDLSEKTKIPLDNLRTIDNTIPYPGDYELGGIIDKLAKALNMDYKKLAIALARQEPPAYTGPVSSVEDDFSNDDIKTIAAHHDDEEWTEEELEEIKQFKEFVRMKREKKE